MHLGYKECDANCCWDTSLAGLCCAPQPTSGRLLETVERSLTPFASGNAGLAPLCSGAEVWSGVGAECGLTSGSAKEREQQQFWSSSDPYLTDRARVLLSAKVDELNRAVLDVAGDVKSGPSGERGKSKNGGCHLASHANLYSVLAGGDSDGCQRSKVLLGRAQTLVRLFESVGLNRTGELPPSIECGGLRKSVRQCFPAVDLQWEFSFKTIAKVERDCCDACTPRFSQLLNEWIEGRDQPVEVDSDHLGAFKVAIASNVERGWNLRKSPFIPNGNATQAFKRKDGGNWNREGFSDTCRAELVFSSGKPRVVTLYSAENARILGPLHYALHASILRWGWLLVGDPNDEHISKLTGADFLSFDYKSATDNIKTAYLQAAVDVLIDRAEGLSDDEIRALRVFSTLKVEGYDFVATRGQPMGSLVSWPLLCIINKTIVDMALNDMLEKGEISFREWSSHPLWVNGDDLLLREPRSDTDIRGYIVLHGSQIGLVVNEEKTMVDPSRAEINSKLFQGGKALKKMNVSAMWMKPDVEDVLGFASQASIDRGTFRKMVRANANILSKQQDKHLYELPAHLQRVCRKDRKIRRAITSLPTRARPTFEGPIRMAAKPDGYDLTREEECAAMTEEIDRVRPSALVFFSMPKRKARSGFRTTFALDGQSYSRATRWPLRSKTDELIPMCYVRCYDLKKKGELWDCEVVPCDVSEVAPFDGSRINHMIDIIRLARQACPPSTDRTPGGSFPLELTVCGLESPDRS